MSSRGAEVRPRAFCRRDDDDDEGEAVEGGDGGLLELEEERERDEDDDDDVVPRDPQGEIDLAIRHVLTGTEVAPRRWRSMTRAESMAKAFVHFCLLCCHYFRLLSF